MEGNTYGEGVVSTRGRRNVRRMVATLGEGPRRGNRPSSLCLGSSCLRGASTSRVVLTVEFSEEEEE